MRLRAGKKSAILQAISGSIALRRRSLVIQPPKFLFIEINRRCNLRCGHCHYWKADPGDRAGFISPGRRDEILGEFAALSPAGKVVTCGGEQMLDLEEYFAVTRKCIALGLRCLSVVNGTCIDGPLIADRMILEGPAEITVSLNSHRAEAHDRSRGRTGSFDMAVRALRLLLDSRARLGRGNPIYAMAVVCEMNYRELEAFYDFVLKDIGADKLKLNFLQPTFGPQAGPFEDLFFERNVIADYRELGRILRRCDRKYALALNPRWLRQVLMYHRSVRKNGDALRGWSAKGTRYPLCDSYDRNIMVDVLGTARLCFSTAFPSARLEEPGDLARFWTGAGAIRAKMRGCTRLCGISHSVRRESATLKPGARGPLAKDPPTYVR
jgi:MoaA/NifB/PqqE/SkfB family radical SAM enzyme